MALREENLARIKELRTNGTLTSICDNLVKEALDLIENNGSDHRHRLALIGQNLWLLGSDLSSYEYGQFRPLLATINESVQLSTATNVVAKPKTSRAKTTIKNNVVVPKEEIIGPQEPIKQQIM